MTVKTPANTQFGRVSNADGSSPLGAVAADDGLAPLVDSHGRVIVTPLVGGEILTSGPTLVDSAGVTGWKLMSAAACKLYQAWGSQISGVTLWVQLFNIAAGPPAGAPYVAPVVCNDQGIWSLNFPEGLSFSTGLVIAYSTAHTPYAAPAVGGWVSGLIR